MKHLLLFASISLIIGCSTPEKVDYAIFSGKIINRTDDAIIVKGGDYNQEVPVAEDGSFSQNLVVKEGYYTINYNHEYGDIYLKPGFDLNLSLDTEAFDESLQYTGKGANENKLLAEKINILIAELPATDQLYKLEEADFLNKVDNYIKLCKSALGAAEVDDLFKNQEEKSIKYEHLTYLKNYPTYHKHFAKKENVEVSELFLKPFENLDMDNSKDFELFNNYRSIVNAKFWENLEKDEKASSILEKIKLYKSENIKNALLKSVVRYIGPSYDDAEELASGIIELTSDEELKQKVSSKIEKVKLLAVGKESPKFAFANTNGESVALDDLKGKLVYIDVWATWSGPCKREIPHLKALEKEYHNESVEFVSISVDEEKDHQKWVDMVTEKELKGLQLFADKSWKSDFIQSYDIEGIPRFILIDKDGKIISSDAPRPSSDSEIKTLLDNHLNS